MYAMMMYVMMNDDGDTDGDGDKQNNVVQPQGDQAHRTPLREKVK